MRLPRTCESMYTGIPCGKPAVYRYRAVAILNYLLCEECAARLCHTPDMSSVGRQLRARLERLSEE